VPVWGLVSIGGSDLEQVRWQIAGAAVRLDQQAAERWLAFTIQQAYLADIRSRLSSRCRPNQSSLARWSQRAGAELVIHQVVPETVKAAPSMVIVPVVSSRESE